MTDYQKRENLETVKIKVYVKTSAGDKKSRELEAPYDKESSSAADTLTSINQDLMEKVKNGNVITFFENYVNGDQVTEFNVTKVRENE